MESSRDQAHGALSLYLMCGTDVELDWSTVCPLPTTTVCHAAKEKTNFLKRTIHTDERAMVKDGAH